MAPPRTAIPASSLFAQKTSQHGRNAYTTVDKEALADAQTDYDDANQESEDDGFTPSQGTAVQKMIIGNLNDRKTHLAINKKKVKESYGSAKVDLQDKITTFFDAHEDQSNATHKTQMKRLADLLAAKATIESQMTAKLAHLRALYDAHSRELTSVMNARIKELK